jgi:hypothetical protein
MRPIAALVLATLLAGCGGSITTDGVTIYRYGPMTGSPAALTTGTLRFLDGCTIVENIVGGAPVGRLILWPPQTTFVHADGDLRLALGSHSAGDGDWVQLGGGEETDQAWVEHLVGDVGRCKSDVYWLAGSMEEVRSQ